MAERATCEVVATPVIHTYPQRIIELLGRDLSLDEIKELLFRLKCEADLLEDGRMEIEVNSDRPDMLLAEGIARAAKGILGLELGMPRYRVVDEDLELRVKDVPSRPYIAVAIVRDVNVDEEFLVELVEFQEKLHATLGRRRRKMAIGLHDLDKLPSRSLVYGAYSVDEVVFTPLHGDKPMSMRQILAGTEQGRSYGNLALSGDKHPLILAGGEPISMPPVINAEITRIEPGTKHLLIDVTGTDLNAVLQTIDIVSTTLAERGGSIGRIKVYGIKSVEKTPLLRVREMRLDAEYASRLLGISISAREAAYHLARMRLDAEAEGREVRALIPPFRADFLHPVDLVEDIAMSIGYSAIPLSFLEKRTRPQPLPKWRLINAVRDLMIGLGFQEILGFMLSNPDDMAESGISKERIVIVANPISHDLSALRAMILPGLLRTLSLNQYAEMPVKVFEVGDVVEVDEKAETKVRTRLHVAAAVMSSKTGFEEIQAALYSLLRNLGLSLHAEKHTHALFMDGRCAEIKFPGGKAILGEVRPEILESRNIRYPVAGFEADLTGAAVPRR